MTQMQFLDSVRCVLARILRLLVFTGSADSEMSEEQKKEKLSELRKKEQEIQDILAKKTKELKKICLREAVRNRFVLHFFLRRWSYILRGHVLSLL